jgi:FKBP-type peptidyl-prolyl cis-trans isomerase FkpA
MKKLSVFAFLIITVNVIYASGKDSLKTYSLPDSMKANAVLAHVNFSKVHERKESEAGIQLGGVKLSLESGKKEKSVVFSFPKNSKIVAMGTDVEKEGKDELEWEFNWKLNESYQLYIATASDSAQNFTLYTGYIYLNTESKWKLIGTCKIEGHWGSLKSVSTFSEGKKDQYTVSFNQLWAQKSNGSWKDVFNSNSKNPVILPFIDVDSLSQSKKEEKLIQAAIVSGKTDAKNSTENVFYHIMKEGTGRQVKLTDTVVVHYKGYLFEDGSIFDQTKENTAAFPLNRLIRGWQLGLTQCKVGGKIKLVIPSGLSYSIRTRSPKIPPNSILVFEVEVVDVK